MSRCQKKLVCEKSCQIYYPYWLLSCGFEMLVSWSAVHFLIQILSRFYPDFIQLLSWFYIDFFSNSIHILALPKFYPDFWKNLDKILIKFEKTLLTCSRHQSLQIFEFQFSKSLFLFIEGGQENIFHWSKKYFRPIKNVFLSPFNK